MITNKLLLVGAAVVVAFLMALSAYAAWSFRGDLAEKDEARVRYEMEQFLTKERQLTAYYMDLADGSYRRIMEALQGVAVVQQEAKTLLEQGRVKDPGYFNQKVPETGVESWLKSRSLMHP